MRILVLITESVEFQQKITFSNGRVDLSNIKKTINNFDEIAIITALSLKERGLADEVIAVSIGPVLSKTKILQIAIALGVDRAILVPTDENLEPLALSKAIKNIMQQLQIDLVLTGKHNQDHASCQIAQMTAALANIPQVMFSKSIDIQLGRAIVVRETDHGLETLSVSLPAVIGIDLRHEESRVAFISKKLIDAAFKTAPEIIYLDDIDTIKRIQILDERPQPERPPCVMFFNTSELVDRLKNDKIL
jgi:electron transfer flavoprotein beta subunit